MKAKKNVAEAWLKSSTTPAGYWTSFIQTVGLPDDERLRDIFLAGFAAGMGYVSRRTEEARQTAHEHIANLAQASDQEAAHRA